MALVTQRAPNAIFNTINSTTGNCSICPKHQRIKQVVARSECDRQTLCSIRMAHHWRLQSDRHCCVHPCKEQQPSNDAHCAFKVSGVKFFIATILHCLTRAAHTSRTPSRISTALVRRTPRGLGLESSPSQRICNHRREDTLGRYITVEYWYQDLTRAIVGA